MIRAVVLSSADPPTRVNVPYSTTRRIFSWNATDMLPISSRNSVPPWAARTCRFRAIRARNAPFSCPNNSLSNSASLKAAQLTSHDWAASRSAGEVDRPRDHLFARAALAEDQDRPGTGPRAGSGPTAGSGG